jgi:TPR repeat protein
MRNFFRNREKAQYSCIGLFVTFFACIGVMHACADPDKNNAPSVGVELNMDSEIKKDARKILLEEALYDFGSDEYDCNRIEKLFSKRLDEYSHANFYRGVAHYKGICIAENLELAYGEFHKGAQLGHLDASYFMALMSYSGVGVKQDVDYANKVFSVLLRYKHDKTIRLMERLKSEDLVNESVLKNILMENMTHSENFKEE